MTVWLVLEIYGGVRVSLVKEEGSNTFLSDQLADRAVFFMDIRFCEAGGVFSAKCDTIC